MITISIDTSNRIRSVIELRANEKIYQEIIESDKPHSERILASIEKVCSKAGINPLSINEINVATGPGSYTGLRVGVAIANTLAFGAQAVVNGKKIGTLAEPRYS